MVAGERDPRAVRHVVIVGGGTAGWSTAAALAAHVADGRLTVTLIESAAIGIIGVGEATIPHIRSFNAAIGLDEVDFMQATGATVKLGIAFAGWYRRGACYFHPFGETVRRIGGVDLNHHARRARSGGHVLDPSSLSTATIAARAGVFAPDGLSPAGAVERADYAYHFDATLYAPLLRARAEAAGVVRIGAEVADVACRDTDGFIAAVILADGRRVAGDLFIDCSGFRGVLIQGALGSEYEDWSRWLPCDRAVAAPSARTGPAPPFTLASAETAGWRWRIPLQHRVGNGYVFCSAFTDTQTAADTLERAMDGDPLATPRELRFTTGHRRPWQRNCVAIGLSGGFLEPLESTSIYLIHRAIMLLIELFPDLDCDPALATEFNRVIRDEYTQIRDFLVLHYTATSRDDTAFWRHCRTIERPDTLLGKLALFEEAGIVVPGARFFNAVSWNAVLAGQGIGQRAVDPRLAAVPADWAAAQIAAAHHATAAAVAAMPSHDDFMRGYAPMPAA